MGPLLPSMNPPPQGMRHCQRNTPAWAGDMKLNVSSEYAPPELGVHGDVPQRLFAEFCALGEATGTYKFMPGIANVCPTLQSAHELTEDTVCGDPRALLSLLNCCTVTVLPMVPSTALKKLFRSAVQPP